MTWTPNATDHWRANHARSLAIYRRDLARVLESHVKRGRKSEPTPADADYFKDHFERVTRKLRADLVVSPSFAAYLVGMEQADLIDGRPGVVVLALAAVDDHAGTLPLDLSPRLAS